jgi:hypothetical protein
VTAGNQVLHNRSFLAFDKVEAPIFAHQFVLVPGILNKQGGRSDGGVRQVWAAKVKTKH